MATKLPQCAQCFGQKWVKVVSIPNLTDEQDRQIYLWSCGGGLPHADPSDMKHGCNRLIAASEEEMNASGMI